MIIGSLPPDLPVQVSFVLPFEHENEQGVIEIIHAVYVHAGVGGEHLLVSQEIWDRMRESIPLAASTAERVKGEP